jgi:SAM-dependent methyltransferase
MRTEMSQGLEVIAKEFMSDDPATKSLRCYAEYDRYFRINEVDPITILEVGVHLGESTKILSRGFPKARIVALDLTAQTIDFSAFPNVSYMQCDQRDAGRLEEIVEREFPEGIDLVLDDASHIGAFTAQTFRTCYPRLKSGGVYVIEDWGTGYLANWPDGAIYSEQTPEPAGAEIPLRLPSHDYGMVGFVKSLVDLAHEAAMRDGMSGPNSAISQIRRLEFTEGICFVMKH